jgi:hypothetical protein
MWREAWIFSSTQVEMDVESGTGQFEQTHSQVWKIMPGMLYFDFILLTVGFRLANEMDLSP